MAGPLTVPRKLQKWPRTAPPKGPEHIFKASHVESEGFQALAVKPGGQPYGGERSGKGEIDQA